MPRIWPCNGCPLREGCDLRDEFRKRAAGTGAITIGFRCSRLASEIRPGRRIVITAPIFAPTDYDGERAMSRRHVTATINGAYDRHSFSCVVDPGQISPEDVATNVDPEKVRFRRKQKHVRIVRFLDEPDKSLCEFGNAKWDGKCDDANGRCACANNAAVMAGAAGDIDDLSSLHLSDRPC